ncbi:unnamed protein product [Acanthosepion pharaonis]|uniref:Uncharacterized protein n=1 Tax=Acanthosepion pharaonis TaxID=158019 RepID=A0A812B2Z4_ACAPH|nr:unnamed protein product [Sepia pharaonis]
MKLNKRQRILLLRYINTISLTPTLWNITNFTDLHKKPPRTPQQPGTAYVRPLGPPAGHTLDFRTTPSTFFQDTGDSSKAVSGTPSLNKLGTDSPGTSLLASEYVLIKCLYSSSCSTLSVSLVFSLNDCFVKWKGNSLTEFRVLTPSRFFFGKRFRSTQLANAFPYDFKEWFDFLCSLLVRTH